jgi:hypothetical protein
MNITELCTIMAEEGSDKSDGIGVPAKLDGVIRNYNRHNYTLKYYSLFNSKRDDIKRVFELGLGTNYTDVQSNMGSAGIPGASLRGWKRYFKNAKIYGGDIDTRILFTEDRIKTYFVDQTNIDSIRNMWELEELVDGFDIIIDDGLHEINANLVFLENSLHKLNKDGIYIIEDVQFSRIPDYRLRLNQLTQKINFEFAVVELEHSNNKFDNCLILIKRTEI